MQKMQKPETIKNTHSHNPVQMQNKLFAYLDIAKIYYTLII